MIGLRARRKFFVSHATLLNTYHAILGRPAYVSFMARPCYVYLKLKMPGPKGVITITGNRQRAEECLALGLLAYIVLCFDTSHYLWENV